MIFTPNLNVLFFTADYNHLDVLDVESPKASEVSPQSVEIFAKMCKKLRFVYQPEMFSNPSLQVSFLLLIASSILEAMKLLKGTKCFLDFLFTSEIL